MEVLRCKAKESSCTLRPAAMLFHGISGDHIQGIMEEMERRSKSESRLAKTVQMNGRETVRSVFERVFSVGANLSTPNSRRTQFVTHLKTRRKLFFNDPRFEVLAGLEKHQK